MPETDATFIGIAVDDSVAGDADLVAKLEEVCPVDIFSSDGGQVGVVEEQLDECVLCELCIQAAPPGTVRVKKLYDGTELGGREPSAD